MALKASTNDQRQLLTLQEADTTIVRLLAKAKSLPQTPRIEQLDTELTHLDRTVLERLGAHDDVTAEVARIESDVQIVAARLQRNLDRLPMITDAKTATATEHENETLERRRGDLEELQLEAMQQQEDAATALAAARSDAETARTEREKLAAERDLVAADLDQQLQAARAERELQATRVPADLLALYDRQRERYGIGATLLQRRTSVASGVELTSSELHEIRQAADDDVILDPNSSAILVRTDESGI